MNAFLGTKNLICLWNRWFCNQDNRGRCSSKESQCNFLQSFWWCLYPLWIWLTALSTLSTFSIWRKWFFKTKPDSLNFLYVGNYVGSFNIFWSCLIYGLLSSKLKGDSFHGFSLFECWHSISEQQDLQNQPSFPSLLPQAQKSCCVTF